MAVIGKLFSTPKQPTSPIRLTESTTAPRNLLLGKTATGGTFDWHGLSDVDRNDNRDLNKVIILAGHQVQRVTKVWAGNQIIYTGSLQHGVRTRMLSPRNDKGFTLVWVTFHDGRPGQAADPYLTGQISDPNDAYMTTGVTRPIRWTSTDKVSGCAYVVITMRHEREKLSTPLSFIFEVEGAALYDRRKDTTAGGAGTQRWDSPSTWVYSDNPAVAADHYQLGMVGGANNDKIIFGMGREPARVPFDEFQANADLCDEQVYGESRYAVNGELTADADHKDNITQIAKAMAARPYDSGGRVLIRPVQARPIRLTLTDADLVDIADIDLGISPGGEDLVNTIRGTYRDPNGRYADIDYPTVSDDDLIARDGRPFEDTLDLPLETSARRAQRLATIELEIQKRRDVINETYMPIANVLQIGDWFQRDSNLRGVVSKVYEVTKHDVNADLTVNIEGRETDPSVTAFGPNQDRPVDIPESLDPIVLDRADPPAITVTPGPETGGGTTRPVVRIFIPSRVGGLEVDYFILEYGISNGLTGVDLGIVEGREQSVQHEDFGESSFEIAGLLPDTTYAWRVRTIYDGVYSLWSDFAEFTTTDEFIATGAENANYIGRISADEIAAQITDISTDALAEITGLNLEAGGVANLYDAVQAITGSANDDARSRYPLDFMNGFTGRVSDNSNSRTAALPGSPETGSLVYADGSPADDTQTSYERKEGAQFARLINAANRELESK